MTSQQTDGTSADHSRSGDDIAEAIEVAERGSAVEEVHDRGTENEVRGGAGRARPPATRR